MAVGRRCWLLELLWNGEEKQVGRATVLVMRRVVESALAPKNDNKVTHREDECLALSTRVAPVLVWFPP